MDESNFMVITVGITTFDRTTLLIETIQSVLSQTYSDLRIIVSNDNPNRHLTAEELGFQNEPRLQIFNQAVNLGEIDNLNWLMNTCQTDLFSWLADDDVLHCKYFETLMTVDLSGNEVGGIYSSYSHGSTLDNGFSGDLDIPAFEKIYPVDFLTRFSSRSIKLLGNYGLFKISTLREMGGFRKLGDGFSPYADTLIPILLANKRCIYYCSAPLLFFRTHSKSISSFSQSLLAYTSAERDFMDYAKSSLIQCDREVRHRIYINFQEWFLENHHSVILRNEELKIVPLMLEIIKGHHSSAKLFYDKSLSIKIHTRFLFKSFIEINKRILRRALRLL